MTNEEMAVERLALKVDCDRCGSKAGKHCIAFTGKRPFRPRNKAVLPHISRIRKEVRERMGVVIDIGGHKSFVDSLCGKSKHPGYWCQSTLGHDGPCVIPESANPVDTETGWLCELIVDGSPRWMMVVGDRWFLTDDSLKAMRFSRKQDVEMFGIPNSVATYHEWCGVD
jgi:hypothetical protein